MRSVRAKSGPQVIIQTEANDLELLSEDCVERRGGPGIAVRPVSQRNGGVRWGIQNFFPRPLRTLQNEVSNLLKSFPNS